MNALVASTLPRVFWPLEQAVLAARALGFHATDLGTLAVAKPLLRVCAAESPTPSQALARALQSGLQGVSLGELELRYDQREPALEARAPALLTVEHQGWPYLVAVCEFEGESATLIAADGTRRRVPIRRLVYWLRQAAEAELRQQLTSCVPAALHPKRRVEFISKLASAQLQGTSLQVGWRLSDGQERTTLKQDVQFAAGGLLRVAGWYTLQYVLAGLAYAFLVQGALLGVTDRGWLQGWLLCLLSVLVVQVVLAQRSAQLSLELGFRIRTRLLGAILAQDFRNAQGRGKGWMLSRVLEAGTLDSNSIGAVLSCVLALVDVLSAGVVLSAVPRGGGLLIAFVGLLFLQVGLVFQYFKQRARWTDSRLELTDLMVEQAAGHRTRVVQGATLNANARELSTLRGYELDSAGLDTTATRLSVVPRLWLATALMWTAWTSMDSGSGAVSERVVVAFSLFAALFSGRALGTVVGAVGQGTAAILTLKHVAPLIDWKSAAVAGRENSQGAPTDFAAQRGELTGTLAESHAWGAAQTLDVAVRDVAGAEQNNAREATPRVRTGLDPKTSSREQACAAALEPGERRSELDTCVLDVQSLSVSDPTGRELVRGVGLKIHTGDRLVLRGASGSGKSTLARVLAGHARATRGVVLASGLDFETLGAAAWVKQSVMVPQFHENHLLSASLAYNILMPESDRISNEQEARVKAVCLELGLGDLLERMPLGVRQPVGDAGWQLSHGERSRVFTARALLRQSRLVILDESIGALDPQVALAVLNCACRRAEALLLIAHDTTSTRSKPAAQNHLVS